MHVIICSECGTEFKVTPIRSMKAKYCSLACKSVGTTHVISKGERYNRLIIVNEIEPEIQFSKGKPIKIRKVKCLCDCGNHTVTRWTMLRNGETKSCGCFKQEQDYKNLTSNHTPIIGEPTHGLSHHPLYSVWTGMKARCYNIKDSAYKDYGGRGITICGRWLIFQNFIDDMFAAYSKGLEIERRNNNGIYEVSNCFWGTRKIQANNKRNTVRVMYGNEEMPLSFACEKVGVDRLRVWRLMRYYKISFEAALIKYG